MSDIDQATGIPEPASVESWLRTLIGFEDARVVDVVALTDGLSNVTCRVELTDAPVAVAVLRVQPSRGIFEPYDILREGQVLKHLAGTAVLVPGVLASESDLRFFGAPFLLLEFIDAAHMPAPEADFDTFAADLPPFAAALAAIHAIDWRAAGLDFLGVPSSAAEGFKGEVEAVARRMPAFGCADEPLLNRALTVLLASTPSGGRLALCHGDPNRARTCSCRCTRHPPARGSRAWSCSGRGGFSSSASCTTAGRSTERNRGSPGCRSRTSLPALSRSCDVTLGGTRTECP
jgi:aminoglycoside phosphotransferase (APT) family kinase protein